MKSNFKRLGDYIEPVDEFNTGWKIELLLGINNIKYFQKSQTNTIGVDLSKYRVVRTNQFAFNRATTRNGDKLSIALRNGPDCIVSPSYRVFRSKDENKLNSEYLMMWFRRPDFDRYARFRSHGSAHEFFDLDEMYEVRLPIPAIEKQREIVAEYHTIQNRIALNNQLIQTLETTAQAIYKQWFVDLSQEKDKAKLGDYINTNPSLSLKKNAIATYVEMSDLTTDSMRIKNWVKRGYIGGAKFQNNDTLLARITPCLENGKTAFVNILENDEVAGGSTEFIVMRAKPGISPYWVYCLAKDETFRAFAISSMIGSSGRGRVHEKYLDKFELPELDMEQMNAFHKAAEPLFELVKLKAHEVKNLTQLKDLLLSKLATVESPVPKLATIESSTPAPATNKSAQLTLAFA